MTLLYFTLFTMFFFNTTLQHTIKKLDLFEDDICRKGNVTDLDHVCHSVKNCETLNESIKNGIYPDVCSFDRDIPIICCPPKMIKEQTTIDVVKTINEKTVLQNMCNLSQYHFMLSGVLVYPGEIKHMTLIGYGETIEDVEWGCGGSLISKRWILTAAHCKEITHYGLARWARLGEINMNTKGPYDYEIIQQIIHPDYKPPSLYNDIALFRINKDIGLSDPYVFPVCLNSNSSYTPTVLTAAGWGRTSMAGQPSQELLKSDLDVFPVEKCNNSYFPSMKRKLKFGILDDRMICAGSVDGTRDTCLGDSGGPLHMEDMPRKNFHLLFGITSFGKTCGDPDAPGVYTRVSYYYSWIDNIVLD